MEKSGFGKPAEAESYKFEPEISDEEVNRVEKEAYRAWEKFSSKKPEEMTIEATVEWLTAGEAYTRKKSLKPETEEPREKFFWGERWTKYKEALDGATGRGDKDKTIKLLKEQGELFQKAADRGAQDLEEGEITLPNELYVVSTFEHIASQSQQISGWKRAAENLRVATRLFENQPDWKVGK